MYPEAFGVDGDRKLQAELVMLAAVSRLLANGNLRARVEKRPTLYFFTSENAFVYAAQEVPHLDSMEGKIWSRAKFDPKGRSLKVIVTEVASGAWKEANDVALRPAVREGYFLETRGAGLFGRFRKVHTPVPEKLASSMALVEPVKQRLQALEQNPPLRMQILTDIAGGLRAAASND
jgi:hypothetical protein